MHIDIDRHADIESPIHRWDPRARVFALLTVTLAMAFTRSLTGAAMSLVLAIGVVLAARLPLLSIWWRMRWVFGVLLVLALAVPAIGVGERPRIELLEWGTSVFLRGSAIVTMTLPVFGCSRVNETFAAFRSLGFPAKLATLILLSYRYLFVFREDQRRAALAMRVRGYEGRPGWHSLVTSTRLVGCLLVESFERTERIHHAMQVRGFRGEFPWRREFRATNKDVLMLVLVLTLVALLLGGDVFWWQRF